MKPRILLIDDDASLRRVTEYNLSRGGFTVLGAASGREGLALFHRHNPDMVITDVQLGDLDGLQILAAVKKESPQTPVLVITAFGSIELAVKAMQEGAFTFLTKPFDREALRLSCRKALEMRQLHEQKQQLSGEVNRLTGTEGMETANSAMVELLDTARRAANSEATVLIGGESGTGKEVLARLIHQHSPRAQGPMVAVNCAAIPENLLESELFGHVKGAFTGAVSNRKGRFQAAAGGTLFLDEIGELRLDLQAKLLRAIQERVVSPVGADAPEAVDVRLIAASNRDLYAAIGQGTFREDLYYRLGVIVLPLPPLRERREDIPGLVSHFLLKVGAPAGVRFSAEALARLKAHPWPGNIREMQNIVERAVILRRGLLIEADELQLAACPQPATENGIPEIPDEGLSLEAVEQGLIKKALAKANGNRSEAARLLKIPRHVLIYRLEKFKI
ncbi:MAG: sigma-54 dependent transcriptional regulator [Proteobacteria bacterium]|nr:sigma-54 dependent transcriptional regulator [Pseudomonadota bacterium]MBU1545142.1 sigma-54 dependent transcriptional regulator [Pseudomonadota bacterium]MBU2618258.1 sigma-54 dependent transcriptional regulator [Pseudomonadota bacterium]